jgi:Rrf2 family protein
MLSRKAKYAIRALIYLARHRGSGPSLIKDIAEKEGLPRKFLESILLEMKSAGLLQAKPGKGGGYVLHKEPRTIQLSRIIRLIDGPLAPIPCVSQTAYAPCNDCPDEKACVLRLVMKEVRDATARILEETTLEYLVAKEHELRSISPILDFSI